MSAAAAAAEAEAEAMLNATAAAAAASTASSTSTEPAAAVSAAAATPAASSPTAPVAPAAAAAAAAPSIDLATGLVRGQKPKSLLAPGEERSFPGGAGKTYVAKRVPDGQSFTCTCTRWVYSKEPRSARTCAHLATLNGAAYESVRLAVAKETLPSVKNQGFASLKRMAETAEKRKEREVEEESWDTRHFGNGWNGVDELGPRDAHGVMHLMLGDNYKLDDPKTRLADPTGFWMTEKLDGVRAWWDGSALYSRAGNCWSAPKWWTEKLPKDLHLDGELWIRRDAFEMTNGICQRSSKEAWKDVNFMAFDVTNVQMLYEERIKLLAERLPDGVLSPSAVQAREKGMHVCVLPMVQCRDKEHCREELHRLEEQGGEGLMLRKPKSKYECRGPGRSKVIWKVKSWYDAEAIVVGHSYGTEKNKRVMGNIIVQMENGRELEIGSGFTDEQRAMWEPKKGTVVRYRFQELLQDGTPRFPIFEGCPVDKFEAKDAIVRSTRLRASGINKPQYAVAKEANPYGSESSAKRRRY